MKACHWPRKLYSVPEFLQVFAMENITSQIAQSWPNILLAWSALAVVAASPGPTASAIMGISMKQGRKAGIVFTAGCMSGATTWAILAGLGLSAWLTSYAQGVQILKILGGLYLLWMAFKALKSAFATPSPTNITVGSDHVQPTRSGKLYLAGLVLHMTNPKAVLGWAAVITLSQSGGGSLAVLLVTLIGCLCITFTIHFTYAVVFASRVAMRAYQHARRWIETTLGVVFGFAGYKLLTS